MDQAPPPGYPAGRPPVTGSAPMATGLHSYPSQYASWSQPGPPPPGPPPGQGYYQQNYGYQPHPQQQPPLPPHGQPSYPGYPPAPTPASYDQYYGQQQQPPPPPHGMAPPPPTSYGQPPPQQGYSQGPYGSAPPCYTSQGYGAPSVPPAPASAPGPGMGYPGQPFAHDQPSYGALTHQGSYPGASAPPMGGGPTGHQQGHPTHPSSQPSYPPAHIALDPYGLPVVAGDQRQERCRMRIEEKIMESTGDSFYIMDERKRAMYTVDGSRTADEYKVLKNAAGGPLLCMRQTSTLKRKIVIFDMDNVPMLTLIRAADDRDRKRVDGYIGGESGGLPAIVIIGNSSASSFKIENNREVVIADVSRASRSMKRLVTGQDSYVVNVSVGAPALIAMMVVAIDEMFCDPHR